MEDIAPLKKTLEQLSLAANDKKSKTKPASNTSPKRSPRKSSKLAKTGTTSEVESDGNESDASIKKASPRKKRVAKKVDSDDDTIMEDAGRYVRRNVMIV